MKLTKLINGIFSNGQVVARFGQAALIRQSDGKWHLQGGSHDDRLAAREWISLFLHEAVISN